MYVCVYSRLSAYLPLEKGKWRQWRRRRRRNFIFTHTYEMRDFQISHFFVLTNCEHKLPASRSIHSIYFNDASAAGIFHNLLVENTIFMFGANDFAIDTDCEWMNRLQNSQEKKVSNTILLFSSSFSFLSFFFFFDAVRLNKLSRNSLDKDIWWNFDVFELTYLAMRKKKWINKQKTKWLFVYIDIKQISLFRKKENRNENVCFSTSKTICVQVRIGE